MNVTPRGRFLLLLALLAALTGLPARAQTGGPTELEQKLRSLDGVLSVRKLDPGRSFKEVYEINVRQSLDHALPDGPSFAQRVYVSHVDFAEPVVLSTEGYASGRPYVTEPARLLQANQVIVEHRFFGTSRPDSLLWTFLTARQSADDLHRVTVMLKKLYPGKWLSTGVSKGGQTTIIYRYFYPGDVDASVPYVAPVNMAQEDPRPMEFLNRVGTDSCRERMRQFQRAALRNARQILPLMEKFAKEKALVYSLGLRKMFEFAVLEYPFAFWQYGRPDRCATVPPPEAPAESLFAHLSDAVNLSMYADSGVRYFAPFQYQAYTELGYYTYDIAPFKDLLVEVKDPSNRIFAPQGVDLTYRCGTFQAIDRWLRNEAENMILIYGGDDPWTASSPQLTGRTNALKMVKKGGSHGTKIRDLDGDQQEIVCAALESWMGKKITRR